MNTHEIVQSYIDKNWLPIPLSGKIPSRPDGTLMKDWPNYRPGDITAEFSGKATNVGIRTDTLTDIDLDCPEAINLAASILPQTATFGRASAQRSHWVYQCDASQYVSYDSSFGKVLELRATNGHQSMVPPSVHPEGEAVRWTDNVDPAEIDGQELKLHCNLLAAASVVSHHWLPGQRDILTTAFSRILYEHMHLDESAIEDLISAIATASGDEETNKRVNKVSGVLRGIDNERAKPGIPTFIATIGRSDALRILDWLGIDQTENVEPADIFSIGEAPDLPRDCLPPILRARAYDVADRISCNPELSVFPGMCAINWAAGTRARIQPLQHDEEFLQPPIFYSFVALPSGTGKSPPRKAMFEPIQKIQDEEEHRYREELENWEESNKKSRGPAPTRLVNVITNTTTEGLVRANAQNPQGILLSPDELAGLLNGANQYKGGRGSDNETFIELYDGSAISSTRKSQEASDYLSTTQVNVYGTIQPRILPTLIRDENVDSGLVARFGLAALPKEIDRAPVDREFDVNAKNDWEDLLRNLRSVFSGDVEDKVVFKFSRDAQPLFSEWREKHFKELKRSPETFRAHLAKYQGLLPRIALCFHLAGLEPIEASKTPHYDDSIKIQWRIPNDDISKETLESAIILLDSYLKPHARRLYSVVDDSPGQPIGRRIASEILLPDSGVTSVTVSEVMRRSRTGLRNPSQISTGFRYLETMGWGSFDEHDQSKSKKPAKRFSVNPKIHESDWDYSE